MKMFIQLCLFVSIATCQAFRHPFYDQPLTLQDSKYNPSYLRSQKVPVGYYNPHNNLYLRSLVIPSPQELLQGNKILQKDELEAEAEIDSKVLGEIPEDERVLLVTQLTKEERLALLHQLYIGELDEFLPTEQNRFGLGLGANLGSGAGKFIGGKLAGDVGARLGAAIGAYLGAAATKRLDFISSIISKVTQKRVIDDAEEVTAKNVQYESSYSFGKTFTSDQVPTQ